MLAGILGHVELLDLKLGDNEVAKPHVDGVLNSIIRAKNLTSQLMDYSNPQAKQDATANVQHIFNEVKELIAPAFNETLTLKAKIDEGLELKIDEGHLQQVFLNLSLNAKDAMPNGGCLCVNASLSQFNSGLAQIEIVDTGTGISLDDQEHIFDPFFTTKAAGKGNGLGLATVYSIIQSYGGSISVASRPGHTTFTILLPVA